MYWFTIKKDILLHIVYFFIFICTMKSKANKQQNKQEKKKPPKLILWWKTEQWLNKEQEAFCQLFTMSDKELFGNGVQCYLEVYNIDKSEKNRYKTACSAASRLLNNVKVIDRINQLLEEWWLNDVNVDKQLSFIITQYGDLSSKLSAIKEYNRLKARVIEKPPVALTYDLSWKTLKEIEEIRKSLL